MIHWFFRTGGPGLLTTSRGNDCELIYRPVGAGYSELLSAMAYLPIK